MLSPRLQGRTKREREKAQATLVNLGGGRIYKKNTKYPGPLFVNYYFPYSGSGSPGENNDYFLPISSWDNYYTTTNTANGGREEGT